MAVVFISPKERQKVFFIGITIVLILFLVSVSFGVFLAKPKEVSSNLVFNKPKITINMSVFDSDQFKKLQPFSEMQIQFQYKARQENQNIIEGFISATSADEARDILENAGLTVINLTEAEIGRENPFTPYFQQAAPAPTPPIVNKK